MPKKEKEIGCNCHTKEHKMWKGIGFFIFGLVLWWTFITYGTLRWDIAFIVIGILIVLKAMYLKKDLFT